MFLLLCAYFVQLTDMCVNPPGGPRTPCACAAGSSCAAAAQGGVDSQRVKSTERFSGRGPRRGAAVRGPPRKERNKEKRRHGRVLRGIPRNAAQAAACRRAGQQLPARPETGAKKCCRNAQKCGPGCPPVPGPTPGAAAGRWPGLSPPAAPAGITLVGTFSLLSRRLQSCMAVHCWTRTSFRISNWTSRRSPLLA